MKRSSFHNAQQQEESSGYDVLPDGKIEAPINEEPQAQHAGMQEPEHYIPITNVTRIMRRILPPHARISDDAKETIQVCVSEYIHFITSEANDRCRQQQRRTVTAEDVLSAMERLGFNDYVEPLTAFLSRHRDREGGRFAPRWQHSPAGPSNPQYASPLQPMPMPPQLLSKPSPPYYGSGFPNDPSLASLGGYSGDGGWGAGGSSNAPAHHDPFVDHQKRDNL